jgi:chromosome segregation protein
MERIAKKDAILAETAEKIESLSEERAEITETLNSYRVDRDTYVQRADALQRMNEHFEGYAESVKYVMKEYASGNISGAGKIHGPLSSLITVDKTYITAIETALGSSLQNIVVENEETAKAAIYALKRGNAGRATFYPISAIKPSTETDEIRSAKGMKGFVGRADTLVESDKEYRSIIEWLLLRTVVFDDIENASDAAKKLRYRVKIVTLDGQVINAGGSFTGGSAKRDSGILSRLTTIAELKEKAEKLDREISKAVKAIAEINDELNAAKIANKDAEQEKELLLTLSRSQFAALDNATAKYNANNDILEKLKSDYENLIGQQSRADEELITLNADYAANLERIEALKSYRAKRSEEMGVLDERRDEFIQKANEISIKIAGCEKDVENVDQMLATIGARIDDLKTERQGQNDRIDELAAKRDGIGSKKSENAIEYEKLEKEIENLRQKRTEVESGND